MADIPTQVAYGQVVGHFVTFQADSSDDGTVPDEVLLTGSITLTPSVPYIKFMTTVPPRTAMLSKIVCRVVNGDLYAPQGDVPGVWLVASVQSQGVPDFVQWTASYQLMGISSQPDPVTFNVPAGGVIDLASVLPSTPIPGTVTVYSSADTTAAQTAAAQAAASAAQAADIAVNANAVIMKYLPGQPNTPMRIWAPGTVAPTATDGAVDGDIWFQLVSA